MIRIDKNFHPSALRRIPFIGKYLDRYFHRTAIGPLLKAHELEAFSRNRLGKIASVDQEKEIWQQWFLKLPIIYKKIFLRFIQTSGLPDLPR